MAIPTPEDVKPWYLRNVHEALALDEVTGNVYLRTDSTTTIGNIAVGNVGIVSLGNVDISGNTMPISGNVNVDAITGNIAGITANVTVVDGGGSLTIDDGGSSITVDGNINANITGGNVNASISGTVTTTVGGTNLDAFGRLRVSNPLTLFDSQNRYIDGEQYATKTNGGSSTVTYNANESSFELTIGTGSGDYVYRQGKKVMQYQPGKSLLALNTFVFNQQTTNMRQRVGYFTANDGVYFEDDGTNYYLVIRSSASGSPVEERIAQSNWNTDTLDGDGDAANPSGYNLIAERVQIHWCDIEWLGVGTVRAGFVINGEFIVCHKFHHANQVGNTKVYMTTASLNSRYEIENTAATGGGTMKQICATVISEGGYTPKPPYKYARSSLPETGLGSADTLEPLATIRLNSAYPDAIVRPVGVDFVTTAVVYGEVVFIKDATLTGASYANVSNSVVQLDTTANAVSGGSIVYSKVFASRDVIELPADLQERLQLERDLDGTSSTLTLAVQTTSNNPDAIWNFAWVEPGNS